MTDLVRINTDTVVGLPVSLADGSRWVIPAMVLINAAGVPMSIEGGTELDTDGNVVPTYKAHTYTYDGSGNLATDTVSGGGYSWTRTYMWANGAQTTDSGWVKS